MLNGWLTPTELGAFHRESTLEIRGSLGIQDTPRGVRGATEPTPADLVSTVEEYRLVPGDVVNIFIFGLRQRGVDSAAQAVLDNRGLINVPVLGWISAVGMTARDLEQELQRILARRDIIYDAQVLVQFAARRGLTYTIFGNESLAVRLNRGPGVFPIPRPDFRLLDALSVSGGLSELVTEIYVFRKTERDRAQAEALESMQSGGMPDVDAGRPTIEEEPEEELEPPPLPSVSLSGGVNAGTFLLAGLGISPGSEQRERSPEAAPPESPPEPEKPAEKKQAHDQFETPPDVQEIIDLMLSGSDETEPPPPEKEEPKGEAPPQALPADDAEGLLDQEDTGRTTKWIFLNGEWVEVAPETPRPAAPVLPEREAPIEPAIDWDSIAESQQEVRIVRIAADALRQGDSRYNIVVRAGDVIRLFSGDIGFYYVTGHVRRPGVYTFRSGATITLKNAVAAAAGLDALGWPDRVTVYRRIGEREQMIQVNLDRIYAGLEPDFYLKKDDIVNVGTHPFAPFLFQIRNLTLPQMGGSITYFYRYVNQKTKFDNEVVNTNNATLPGLFP